MKWLTILLVLGIVGFGYILYKSMRYVCRTNDLDRTPVSYSINFLISALDPARIQPSSRVLGAAAFIDVVSCVPTLYADDTNPSSWASSWGGLWREGKIHVSRPA